MAEYLNATCSICGTKYHICNSCSNTKSFTPWRVITCSKDCYQIFLALCAYTNGYATKEETKDALTRCNLCNLQTFEKNIKTSIKGFLEADTSEPNGNTATEMTQKNNE